VLRLHLEAEPVPNLLTDVQYAARMLRRNAGFAATMIAALSLGIAANTAIFSVVNKVLLEPLPYPDPDRLVQLMSKSPIGDQAVVSIPKYGVWMDLPWLFQYVAAYDFAGPDVNLTGDQFPQPLETARVSADYFRLFGLDIVVGRTFSNQEDRPGASRVTVISERLWRGRFNASTSLVGNIVSLDREAYKIIGVLAPGPAGDKPVDVWLPLQADLVGAGHMNRVRVTARMKPGVTLDMVNAELARSKARLLRRYPGAPLLFREEFTAIPLREALVGDVRSALVLLTGAVGFVLLIACANVGSLVLARGSRRTAEVAVRSALGAARSQVIRQLWTESMLIAIASSMVGLILGFGGVRGLLMLSPPDLPRIGANGSAIALDWRVFLFTLGVSLLSGVLFGLLPAMSASRADLISLVKDSPVQSGAGFRRGRGRAFPVVGQVALALVLLTGAGLLIRTFLATRITNRGFDEQNVLTAQMSLNGPQFERTRQVAGLVRKIGQQMKQGSGVVVATTSSLPLEAGLTIPFTAAHRDQSLVGRYHGTASWRSISPEYFNVFRIRLLRGRFFSDDDDQDSARVVLIDRAMMRRSWPEVDANPIGEFIVIGKGVGKDFEDTPRQIIGVVDEVREAGLRSEPMMYVPVAQLSDEMTARNNRALPITWVFRTSGDPASQSVIERELREAGGLPLGTVRTMHEIVAASSARTQFYLLLLSVFSVIALLLAAVGLYGVLTYSVQQRTREIGLRMALGADPGKIRKMVVWQGMRLALVGILVGIPVSLALTRVMVGTIFGVRPADPAVIAGVSMLLAAVAFIASYLPSMRATGVSPCESLRR
jgi:putative ABC transport system permease protein